MKKVVIALVALLSGTGGAVAQNAEEIMASVRQVAGLQEAQDLHGYMKSRGKKVPMTMLLRGKEIHFQIDGGKDAFALQLGPVQQRLFDTRGGQARAFQDKRIAQPIAGTEVSYEDLALKFLYWPNPRIAGESSIKGQACWRIHLTNPEKTGRYREVSAWVSKEHRALLRIIGYGGGPNRPALKQFEVLDIMKRAGKWTARKLSVSAYNEKGRKLGTTYIDFGKKKSRRKR